jgi:hypothetical protein
VQREIWTSLSVRYFNIWDPFKPDIPSLKSLLERDRFAGVWSELLDRVLSLPADTPAIFANLLGVSAYKVLKRKAEQEQVALIIQQQNVLPIKLLSNTGPRLRGRLSAHGSEFVTVYEERTLRVPRVLSWCSSLTSMSTFYSYQHQRYVM